MLFPNSSKDSFTHGTNDHTQMFTSYENKQGHHIYESGT